MHQDLLLKSAALGGVGAVVALLLGLPQSKALLVGLAAAGGKYYYHQYQEGHHGAPGPHEGPPESHVNLPRAVELTGADYRGPSVSNTHVYTDLGNPTMRSLRPIVY